MSKTAPIKLANTINQRYPVLKTERTKCGAARPTKAIKPVCATAVPVAIARTPISTMRMEATGKPRLRAVVSPRLRPSSTRPSAQAMATPSNQTTPINPHAAQPAKAVEPNINDCMACKDSGENNKTNWVAAPKTTPTTTPASNKRKVCCTPRDKTRVSNTAKTAPTKAAPVNPRRTSKLPEYTLKVLPALIMVPPNMPPAPPMASSASATPSAAPEALPSKYGSASGLRNKP